DQIHKDHDHQRVRNVVGQDRDCRGETRQREPEGFTPSSRGRRQLAAQKLKEAGGAHRSTERQVPLTVATAEAPMRKESSGLSTLMRIGKRAARRIQSSERSTRGSPLTLVPFSGSTAQPSPTTVPRKCLLGCDCR